MRKWKTYQIVLFALLCLGLNVGGRVLAAHFQWPFWMDSLGTMLYGYMAGPSCGALLGLTSNLLYGHMNAMALAYSLTSIGIGVIMGFAGIYQWMDNLYEAMRTALVVMLIALAISLPLNWIVNEGYTNNIWGDAIIKYFQSLGWSFMLCAIVGQLLVEFSDKVLLVLILFIIVKIFRRLTEEDELVAVRRTKAGCFLILLLGLGVGTMSVQAADIDFTDYNDYVKTVYSGNNGLPCGQANDIVQTNDGVLWIGTYAGLYRYNGLEFRWISNYDSVRNVNCLYVDEEGRLWIGTNDNGLSIAINEKIVNVIDQNSGLPSNSVRSIIQSSDGYYYIGTTSSMQILAMNNGLRVFNTIREINYAECIAADDQGHVAALTSDGRLFLLREGRILSSLRLSGVDEVFNCCTFAPDGSLMAGTSTNHIYRYDIADNGFELKETITLDGVTRLNRLYYLEDGVLFITSDNCVAYMGKDKVCHLVNTNEFNASIYKMLQDYQGNLWFTSTRLGLLRMANSAFKDVYGTVGMERCVVNAITRWQNCYYIGTDNGLDIVDSSCRNQIENELTARLKNVRIRCLCVDSQDDLWICTYGTGLLEVSPDGQIWQYDEQSHGIGNRARLATELSDGTLAAGTDTGVVFIRNHEVVHTIGSHDGLTSTMILSITERSDGTVLAGTDGGGIAIIEDGTIRETITQANGLTSGVILRTIKDPKSDGVMLVTSNGLCYLEEDNTTRPIKNFPYYNNYDIRSLDGDILMIMSSAGVYIVERDDLVADRENMPFRLLDTRSGLSTALTANSWNYLDDQGDLFLPCDTGMYIIDTRRYNQLTYSYRIHIASLYFDNTLQSLKQTGSIVVDQGVNRLEIEPEILNYTIQDPNVGYILEGYDQNWTLMPHSKLGHLIYTNLPSGQYTLRLAVFDSTGDNILEELQLPLIKKSELYEQRSFAVYLMTVLVAFFVWITWLLVQRQINKQKVKLEMANETVVAIANAVDAKDVRTSQHSKRVAEYSVMIAKEMGCYKGWQRDKRLENLRRAAQMHDIGKIGIRDNVLNKVGRLTNDEYAEMKSHVTRGADILKDFTLVENVAEGANFHHERYDGRGYPLGLKGEDIPLIGRIIGVADAFDAMTSNRVYRNQMDTDYVMNEMKRGRGTQFDPNALDAFLRLVDKGIIDLEALYSEKAAEISEADQKTKEEVARRVEEDRKIQEAAMKKDSPEPEAASGPDGGEEKK